MTNESVQSVIPDPDYRCYPITHVSFRNCVEHMRPELVIPTIVPDLQRLAAYLAMDDWIQGRFIIGQLGHIEIDGPQYDIELTNVPVSMLTANEILRPPNLKRILNPQVEARYINWVKRYADKCQETKQNINIDYITRVGVHLGIRDSWLLGLGESVEHKISSIGGRRPHRPSIGRNLNFLLLHEAITRGSSHQADHRFLVSWTNSVASAREKIGSNPFNTLESEGTARYRRGEDVFTPYVVVDSADGNYFRWKESGCRCDHITKVNNPIHIIQRSVDVQTLLSDDLDD